MSTTPQKTASIVLTSDEARVLLELIDVAIKALGIKGAEAGVVLYKKINAGFAEEATKLEVLPKE